MLVEFAFVLPIFLVLLYGMLVYSIVFVTQQAVAFAAESGADSVVTVAPQASNYDALATARATARVNEILGFLPGAANTAVDVGTAAGIPGRQVTVTVRYSFSEWGLPAPAFLPLPATLTGVGLKHTEPAPS